MTPARAGTTARTALIVGDLADDPRSRGDDVWLNVALSVYAG